MKNQLFLFVLLGCFLSGPLFSKDFGKKGKDNSISEEDFADAFMKKLQSKFSNEDLEQKIKAAAEKAIVKAERPNPVSGLVEAVEYYTHLYDPVVTFKEDIKSPFGVTIVKSGQKIDPTKIQGNPDFGFIFFDGDNAKHLAWAKEQDDFYDWVLVKGAPFELSDQEDRPVYFDQAGELVKKLKIKQIPCRVSPEGKFLKVEEIPIQ